MKADTDLDKEGQIMQRYVKVSLPDWLSNKKLKILQLTEQFLAIDTIDWAANILSLPGVPGCGEYQSTAWPPDHSARKQHLLHYSHKL